MESVISTREEILHFLSPNLIFGPDDIPDGGCDNDDTCGFGFGYGYCYYSGCGYSTGRGDGSGNGKDYSDGDGYGNGSGVAGGDGRGLGRGYEYDFSNKDIKTLNGNILDYVDYLPTIITQVRGNIACGYIVNDDLTLSPCFIAKAGNSFAHGNTLKEAVEDAEAKEMGDMPIEERIKKFVETFGSLDSEHTGKEFYAWHHILTGSCRMGRDEFCKAHNVDLEKMYSVKYFLDLTKESYGSNVIKQVRESYKLMEE